MTYNSELIRSGLFFSGLWKIGFALFDLNSNTFYFTSQEFISLTGIADAMGENSKENFLRKLVSKQDFDITERMFDFIRAEIASKTPSQRCELSFYSNVRLLGPTGQVSHLTFNILIEPDREHIRPNTLSLTCIPEQLFGYDRFTLHNLTTKKILYYWKGYFKRDKKDIEAKNRQVA